MKHKYSILLLGLWLLSACSPGGQAAQTRIPTLSLVPPIAVPGDSPALSAEALSEILWVSDPSLPQYDPDSPEYARYPEVVLQISALGADAVDAADDLAVALRYPRQDAFIAAQALLNLGPDITATTLSLLIDNLRGENANPRIYSLILLASVGSRASCAVGDIAPRLWDADPLVRSAAALALERITQQDLVASDYEVLITPSFLAASIAPDMPEGRVTDAARSWWNTQGSKVNWHPSYDICDP